MAARGRKKLNTKIGAAKRISATGTGPSKMEHLRAQVVIHGLVQGVFFRASTREEALRIGVSGWVRNLPDGTVQALFEGEKKKVEELIGWCHKGPPGARVSTVDIIWEPYKGEYQRFDIRYGYVD
jgi:acylphosphatase